MDCIVNVTQGWAIGWEGKLQVSLREDMRRFRTLTAGKTLVMGRKTLESFPGGKPLKNRRNIVLTRRGECPEGAEAVRSPEELFALLRGEEPESIMVIGGAEIYRLLLPWCSRAFVTKTDLCAPADAWFPNLDALANWEGTAEGETMEENGVAFRFYTYRNREALPLPEG